MWRGTRPFASGRWPVIRTIPRMLPKIGGRQTRWVASLPRSDWPKNQLTGTWQPRPRADSLYQKKARHQATFAGTTASAAASHHPFLHFAYSYFIGSRPHRRVRAWRAAGPAPALRPAGRADAHRMPPLPQAPRRCRRSPAAGLCQDVPGPAQLPLRGQLRGLGTSHHGERGPDAATPA